ncbi:MAG: hypothetical protein FWG33_00610 [Oscillospiraceae bacterium]|nr:hypothetical protein [Oscillospiraceae bacterium]
MFFQKKPAKIISSLIVIAIILSFMSSVISIANEPWVPYNYDWWLETYPVQSGYVVDRVITSNELKLDPPLKSPKEVFIYEDDDGEVSVYIADSDNHRIIITDLNFENVRELKTFTYTDDYRVENFVPVPGTAGGSVKYDDVEAYWAEVGKINTKTTLQNPSGIFVQNFRGETRVYIADHNNERVLACDLDGNIWMEYKRPGSEVFDPDASFRPKKVLADNAGNVYVCLTTIAKGALVFSEEGVFRGFYGANRVTKTATAILNSILRLFMSREMMAQRFQPNPVEFSGFTIDSDQFIYTVTESRSAGVDIVKKLNPSGQNVYEKEGKSEWTWGAWMTPYVYGKTFMSTMVDISVNDKGDLFLLDRESGQVFQYDQDGWLMFTFGGKGEQKGLFTAPTSVETYGGKVYVLDSTKNSLTVFKPTEFGELVIDAMGLFNRGLYAESLEPWGEVLKRDANFYMAYVGMGNAKLSIGEFDEALDYFHMHSYFGYNQAFKDFRVNYMRENFDRMLVIAVIAVAILIGTHITIKIIRKRKG